MAGIEDSKVHKAVASQLQEESVQEDAIQRERL
jgi:hypothetical protein